MVSSLEENLTCIPVFIVRKAYLPFLSLKNSSFLRHTVDLFFLKK